MLMFCCMTLHECLCCVCVCVHCCCSSIAVYCEPLVSSSCKNFPFFLSAVSLSLSLSLSLSSHKRGGSPLPFFAFVVTFSASRRRCIVVTMHGACILVSLSTHFTCSFSTFFFRRGDTLACIISLLFLLSFSLSLSLSIFFSLLLPFHSLLLLCIQQKGLTGGEIRRT